MALSLLRAVTLLHLEHDARRRRSISLLKQQMNSHWLIICPGRLPCFARRAAGTADTCTIKDELWDGLDHTLAYLVYPRPDEAITEYKARIRAAESSTRRTWEATTNRANPDASSARIDRSTIMKREGLPWQKYMMVDNKLMLWAKMNGTMECSHFATVLLCWLSMALMLILMINRKI